MIKEIIILTIAFLALCNGVPVEDAKPEVVAVAVPVESDEDSGDILEGDEDLTPAASAWGGYGGGWGRGYYGGGWGGGWGRGYGGWGGHRGYGWGGHRGYGGWGRRYW